MATIATSLRAAVAASLAQAPIIGVVRTTTHEEAEAQAHALLAGGIELIEITFSVPEATRLVAALRTSVGEGPPWIGMGTVTTSERAREALRAGAQFLVSPNASSHVAAAARAAEIFLALGALTPTEIVEARRVGADLVKVYPLPPVGGPRYLATVRQPLADIPMLAAGGFTLEEIPAYRRAGAIGFGLAAPLLTDIPRALALARGEERA